MSKQKDFKILKDLSFIRYMLEKYKKSKKTSS
jgi:hypothetical protein